MSLLKPCLLVDFFFLVISAIDVDEKRITKIFKKSKFLCFTERFEPLFSGFTRAFLNTKYVVFIYNHNIIKC